MSLTLKKSGVITVTPRDKFDLLFEELNRNKEDIIIGVGIESDRKINWDFSIHCLNDSFKYPNEKYLIYYNNRVSPDGAVEYLPEDFSQKADEFFRLNLSKMDHSVKHVSLVFTLFEAQRDNCDLGSVNGIYIHLYDANQKNILLEYKVDEYFEGKDSLVISSIFQTGTDWNFEIRRDAFSGGLGALVKLYQ